MATIMGNMTGHAELSLTRTSLLEAEEDPHAHLKADTALKPPSGPSERYYSFEKLNKAHRDTYVRERPGGSPEVIASSRTVKSNHPLDIPLGAWQIDDGHKGLYGRDIDELQAHKPRDIQPSEFDWKDPAARLRHENRIADAYRYADWLEQEHNEREARGEGQSHARIPPVTVVKHDKEHLVLSGGGGHRRLAAVDILNQRRAKQGKPPLKIPAWTSWSAEHPEKIKDSQGQTMKVGLTHEIAVKTPKINREHTPLKEHDMGLTVTNMKTGEIVTSFESRAQTLASIQERRELRESGQEILFWSEDHRPQDYEHCIRRVPVEDVDRVITALQTGAVLESYRGWTNCRLCGEQLGSADVGAHGFVWPQLAEHYVVEHGVWTPDLSRFAEHLLAEDEKRAKKWGKEDTKDRAIGGKHCGVFIPLPYSIAKDFPDKSDEDSSVPHYTVLYVGDLGPKAYRVFVDLVRKFAQKIKPFECDTYDYGEFLNREGQKIPHMRPSAACGVKLALLHAGLRRHIEMFGEEIGIRVGHRYGQADSSTVPYEVQFKPHATLAYLSPMIPYLGPRPTGCWRVTELECWGHEQIRIPLGKTKVDQPTGLARAPLAIKYPMAMPDAVAHEDVIGGSEGARGHGVGGSAGDDTLHGSLPYLAVQQEIDKKLRRKKLAGLK